MTQSAAEVVPESGDVARRRKVQRWFVSLPDRLLTGFLAVSVVVSLALVVEQFRPWLVLPLALLAVVLTRRWVPRTPVPNRAAAIGTLIAIAIAVVWCVMNVPLASEIMGVDRDPGQYTLSGLYLMHHPGADVSIDAATIHVAQTVNGAVVDWTGVAPAPIIHIQGTSLVPGLIAVFGWILGPAAALHALVVVAGIALVGLYAVARRLLGPMWSLLPVLALALSMPLAAFGRMPYTEPSSLIFTCGTLLCLWAGLERSSTRLFGLAGLFAGASVIARIDGGLTLIGGVIGLGAVGLFSVGPARRKELRRWIEIFLLGSVITAGIGAADLLLHSPKYVKDQMPQVRPMVAALVVCAIIALLCTVRLRPSRLAKAASRYRRRWMTVTLIVTAVILLLLVSRPWWLVSRLMTGSDYIKAIAGRQAREGLPIDGTHSYDEYTVNWLAWYYGWAMVAAAAVGVLLALRRIMLRRDAKLAILLAIPAVTSLVYLNRASITPDQIWAMRRMVPVIVPGMLLVAGYAFRETALWTAVKFRAVRASRPQLSTWARTLAPAAAVIVFAAPILSWGQLFDVREGAGEQQFVADICAKAPGDRMIHAGPNPFGHFVPALQQACGKQALGVANPTTDRMAAVAAAWGDPTQPILVVTFAQSEVSWQGGRAGTALTLYYQRWEELLMRRPSVANARYSTAWVGVLQPDGTVKPINFDQDPIGSPPA